MTTTTEKPNGPTIGERIVIGAALAVIGSLLGSIVCPGAGTVIGAKLGGLFGGSAS